MLNSGLYAVRKRRRPMQKIKPVTPEGVKSNPSKRHRERLNAELERLAGMLPFPKEVINKLDKLSVLRLSVSYLRAKSFFEVSLQNQKTRSVQQYPSISNGCIHAPTNLPLVPATDVPEGDFMLQALNGFVLVVTPDGMIFYSSHTIQDYLGFHQSDVINQNVFELIHTEDREGFRRQLHWCFSPPPVGTEAGAKVKGAGCSNGRETLHQLDQLPPENSEFLNRSFQCRFRCLLDSVSGFLALHFQGKLKFLHGQKKSENDTLLPPQLALFAVAIPVQPLTMMEIRTTSIFFRTKHKLDFTPLSCDAKANLVLGWTEAELRMHSGYQFIHFEDMLHCAENHLKAMKTGDSGLTIFRILCKDNRWQWVQAFARIVYKDGQPNYIISNQRPLTDAEGEEHFQKRASRSTKFTLSEAALLYECSSGIPQVQLRSQPPTVKTDPDEFQGQRASKAMEDAMKNLGGSEYGPLEMLTFPPVEGSKLPAGFCGAPLAGSSTEGADMSVGSLRNGKTYPVNSSPDVALEGLEEMLQSYGLTPEDLIHQEELIKHIEFDNLSSELNTSSIPNDILSEVESLSLSLNSRKNISCHIERSVLLPVSDDWHSTQSSSLCSSILSTSWTATDVVSPSSQLYSPEQPKEHYHCWQSFPGSNITNLQINSTDHIPNATCSVSQSALQLNSPVEKESQLYFQMPTQNLSTVNVENTFTQQNIFNGQTNWLNQPGLMNPTWPLYDGDTQEPNVVISTGYLPKGVMSFIAPASTQGLLYRGLPCGNVQ
ncbi:aryl hydrocarbon receptor-like [Heptranchias perlo]|uniref:aryl hydrocarbon receptor-like n=1 Tax=Heptranchias perlo TaxID=212740 RepID=UPI00355958BE